MPVLFFVNEGTIPAFTFGFVNEGTVPSFTFTRQGLLLYNICGF